MDQLDLDRSARSRAQRTFWRNAKQAKIRPSLIFCQLRWAMIDHP
jgi:hypothetical protein